MTPRHQNPSTDRTKQTVHNKDDKEGRRNKATKVKKSKQPKPQILNTITKFLLTQTLQKP